MKRIINRPTVKGIDVAQSPITAMWQAFSKRGRELTKLQEIFEGVLRNEEIQKKVNTEMLRKLLNDDSITYEQYRIFCPEITDDFILAANGYDLDQTLVTA